MVLGLWNTVSHISLTQKARAARTYIPQIEDQIVITVKNQRMSLR